MNVLLLSNSAPNYHHFFKALATLMARDGASVAIAVDSAFSRQENRLDELAFAPIHEFAAFFAAHKTDQDILTRYADFNLNAALLSDFERAATYRIWGSGADIDYFDRLKSALLAFFEEIIERYAIDVVLYENVSNAFAHFALFVAQKKGARYCGISGSRLPGRFQLTEDPLADHEVANNFAAIQSGQLHVNDDVRDWAARYISQIETVVPDYMKINRLDQLGLFNRYFRRDRIDKFVSLLRHIADSRTDNFQIGNPLRTHASLFLRNAGRRLRSGRVRKCYQKPVQGERFLLYPLHFHPESSTSILAGAYLDEYEVIRNIAFSLPEGMRLYVKDHLSAWAFPSLDFYHRIRQLPNVRVLAPDEPTKQLIRLSAGVITLTSTVGYEALLLKKRVFLYGRVFYEFHNGVTRIDNPAALHDLLTDTLGREVYWDDAYNLDFVCAYHAATLPGTLNLMQGQLEATKVAQNVYEQMRHAGGLAAKLPAN